MKRTILILLSCAVGVVFAWQIHSQRSADALQREKAQWQKQKADLELALEAARNQPSPEGLVIEKKEIVRETEVPDASTIIQRLLAIKVSPGPTQIRKTRTAIQQFENLIGIGSPAIGGIREFLLKNQDIEYDSTISLKGSRDGKIPTEFPMPPSLRFGLFEATKRIGGSDAEKLLAESLTTTGRGAEVAYLAYALHELVPGKYRDLSVNSARELLSRPIPPGGAGLDKYDREYLYGVLSFYGDTSATADARGQLVGAGGIVDRAALRYLQQSLGVQALQSVVQAYQDPNVDPSKREPLVRYALTYAGEDPSATEFWHNAVNDQTFPFSQRRELIEDLNQDGLQNEDNPTPRDALLIAARLELIEKYYSETQDPVIRDAWREAGKDLKHMGQKFLSQSNSPYVLGEDTTELRGALRTTGQATP
jgi:hypothetical protein